MHKSARTDISRRTDWNWDIPKKVEAIAKNIYGAKAVEFTAKAKDDLEKIQKLGLDKLPVCMAKTQNSLSDNPKLRGRPENFLIVVREIEIAAGAGFVIPITGEMMRMPGLPAVPAAENVDVDEQGNTRGCSNSWQRLLLNADPNREIWSMAGATNCRFTTSCTQDNLLQEEDCSVSLRHIEPRNDM